MKSIDTLKGGYQQWMMSGRPWMIFIIGGNLALGYEEAYSFNNSKLRYKKFIV